MREQNFRAALLDPDRACPDGLIGPSGRPAGRRFDVYRNNVTVSLTDALRNYFPVIAALVGSEFFVALARAFLRAYPPRSPVLFRYGDALPAFLSSFPPVAHLPYLADVARLELAIKDAYHAADAAPIGPEALSAVSPDSLLLSRLVLAPSLRVVRSGWPIHAIWSAHVTAAAAPDHRFPQDVIVFRPEFDPVPVPAAPPVADFVGAIMTGASLGQAIEAAGFGFDLSDTLALLGRHRALVGLDTGMCS